MAFALCEDHPDRFALPDRVICETVRMVSPDRVPTALVESVLGIFCAMIERRV
jgi:hypothetical protein